MPWFQHLFRMSHCLGAVLLTISPAYADFFLHSWEDQYEIKSMVTGELVGMYYSTHSNFDTSSTQNIPLGFQNYNRVQSDFLFRAGLFEHFSVFGRLSWAYINQNSAYTPGTV